MMIAGTEIDESAAVAYMRKEWDAGRPVAPCDIQCVLLSWIPEGPDRHWLAAEAQRRICQWYRKRGACKYDRQYGWWAPA